MHKKSRGEFEYKGERTHDGLKTTFLIPIYLKWGFTQMNHHGGFLKTLHPRHAHGAGKRAFVSAVQSLTMKTWVWLYLTLSPPRSYSPSNFIRSGSERAFGTERWEGKGNRKAPLYTPENLCLCITYRRDLKSLLRICFCFLPWIKL